jgi:hypothetical protein
VAGEAAFLMTQIGRYTIVRQTGSHGDLALYEGFDPVMKRPVTIRMAGQTKGNTSPGATSSVVLFDSTQVANLDHPNIVKILAWDNEQDRPYLVMEQFNGTPLSEALSKQSTLPLPVVAEILKNAAAGLDHAHLGGLVHQNINLETVLRSEDGQLKIAGFDLAQSSMRMGEDRGSTDAERLLANLPYVAPEVLLGTSAGAKSDQYSLAAIAWKCLIGKTPFEDPSGIRLMQKIVFEKSLPQVPATIPAAVVRVLERALSKDPASRFSNCRELAAGFESAYAPKKQAAPAATRYVPAPPAMPGAPPMIAPPAPTAVPVIASPRGLSTGWIVTGAVVLFLIVAVGVAMFLLRSGDHPAAVQTPVQAPVVVPEPPKVEAKKPKPKPRPVQTNVTPQQKAAPPPVKEEPPAVAPAEPKVL